MAAHPRPLGHLSIGVRSCHVSKAFYTAILNPLGLHLVYDSWAKNEALLPGKLGFGPDADHEMVNIFECGDDARAPGAGSHVAFNAPTRTAVEEFHAAALLHGGQSNGEPGLRAKYGPNYYAAFVVDPDGWRLEAVCKMVPDQAP
jgi:catechol 2,3-dioxygenase-like lactoylglutathione lyase family enzyme